MTRCNEQSTGVPASSRLRVTALLLAYLAVWMAARPYEGIVLDAQLYSLQALATLNPSPLADDLFLRFGSQNNFTLFPRLAAPLIGRFGLEAAAAGITVASALLLLAAGWLLARRLSTPRLAWLAAGLLICIPGWYGAGDVLRYDEMYLNARLPAEALSIFALWFACGGRWWLAAVSAAIAAMVHPLMALPACGLLTLLAIDASVPTEYRYRGATAVALAGTLVVCVAAWFMTAQGDPDYALWIGALRSRSAFMFLQNWRGVDWLQNALGIGTLLIASDSIKPSNAARTAYFAALIGMLGIGLAALASMVSHFDFLLLAQSWRWAWLSRFVALVVLPPTLAALWKSGTTGRTTALLLASGWALFNYSGGVVVLGAAAAWFARAKFRPSDETAILKGAYAIACVAVVALLALGLQGVPLSLDTHSAPRWVQRIVNVAGLAGPIALVACLAWYVAMTGRSLLAVVAMAIVSSAALVGLARYDFAQMTGQKYSELQRAAFSEWRKAIPPSAEVLWNEPVPVWVLLGRKSFLSGSQSAGLVYSRAATREFARRARALSPLASPGWWTLATVDATDEPKSLTVRILREICREPQLGFVVDKHELAGYTLRAEWPTLGQYVFLYDCNVYRAKAD